jgi:DNA primase
MSRAKRRADRIREQVPLLEVLAEHGYKVQPGNADRQQQFSCDLHGDGSDSKPSARYYPESHSYHCFACGQSRDVIKFLQEKEGITFWAALGSLERKFRLPEMPWEEGEEKAESVATTVQHLLEATASVEDTKKRVERSLRILTSERMVTPQDIASLWEAFDRVVYLSKQDAWSDAKTISEFLLILSKSMDIHT